MLGGLAQEGDQSARGEFRQHLLLGDLRVVGFRVVGRHMAGDTVQFFVEGLAGLHEVGRGRGRGGQRGCRFQGGQEGGDGFGLGRCVGSVEHRGHRGPGAQRDRVGDPLGQPAESASGTDPGEGRCVGGQFGHATGCGVALGTAEFGEQIPAPTQQVGLGDLDRGGVAQRADRDRIEGHFLARPIHAEDGFAGRRGRIFGEDLVGSLVQADLGAVDPHGVLAVGIEHDDLIEGDLEMSVEEPVEHIITAEVHREISGPGSAEGTDRQEGGRRFTGGHEQGDAVGSPVIGGGSGAEGLGQPRRAVGRR